MQNIEGLIMHWIELKTKVKQILNQRDLSNPGIRLNALERLEGIIRSHFINIYNNPLTLLQIDKNKFKEMISHYKKLNSAESSIINNFYQILGNGIPKVRDSNKSISPKKIKGKSKKKKPVIVNSAEELINPIFGLEPIINKETRILILGTFPAKESIDVNFYYQNQIKRFWGQALSLVDSFEAVTNEERKKLLLKNKIGLWDIFECAEREGSNQDKAIKKAKYNNIEALLENYPSINYLIFNGKNAYQWLNEDKSEIFLRENLKTKRLQSSSGGNGWFNKGNDWKIFFEEIGY